MYRTIGDAAVRRRARERRRGGAVAAVVLRRGRDGAVLRPVLPDREPATPRPRPSRAATSSATAPSSRGRTPSRRTAASTCGSTSRRLNSRTPRWGPRFVVTNGVPVIAERAMWWPGDASTWQEGHNSFGATETGEKWGLAEGEVGGPTGLETYILLANTSSTDGVARVTLTFEDGSPQLTRDVPMAANSRANVAVAVDFPDRRRQAFRRGGRERRPDADAVGRRAGDVQQLGRRVLGRGLERARHQAALRHTLAPAGSCLTRVRRAPCRC